MISITCGIDSSYEIPDALWNRIILLLLPKTKCKKKQIGRPRMDDRKAMTTISSIYSTYWMSVESTTTKKSWCIQYCTWQVSAMEKRWYIQTNVGIDGLKLYDKKFGINWKWQSMDGAITKAPLGGKKYRTKSNRHKK